MKRTLVIEVLRDEQGKLYSQVRDTAKDPSKPYQQHSFVIDRQRGRHLDGDTIISRAQLLSELSKVPYAEDLTWPCRAARGYTECACPRCAAVIDERARR